MKKIIEYINKNSTLKERTLNLYFIHFGKDDKKKFPKNENFF